ncbi:hypothetical protein ElyMa_004210100 [Elysia marginata]|uniref:Uncharacterized protein n=1 Tax=Elysia marginata TaxID=1093978 RepID=A0AAV4GN64_9GAST|nr:hypothetical protein ElyMa_004210100 [Elysia marginata]
MVTGSHKITTGARHIHVNCAALRPPHVAYNLQELRHRYTKPCRFARIPLFTCHAMFMSKEAPSVSQVWHSLEDSAQFDSRSATKPTSPHTSRPARSSPARAQHELTGTSYCKVLSAHTGLP